MAAAVETRLELVEADSGLTRGLALVEAGELGLAPVGSRLELQTEPAEIALDGAEDLNCSWQAAQVVKDGSLPGMMLGRSKLLFLVMVARLQAKMELARWLRGS